MVFEDSAAGIEAAHRAE
ncbi:MAG: hypothetical protein V8T01_03505 [Oscillospiraceae bacterium]